MFAPISFTLEAGQTLILRGDNGSGKTTLLRTLAGLMPSSVTLHPSLLYLGHANALHPSLTVIEHLDFWRGLRSSTEQSKPDILHQLGLVEKAHALSAALSQGQKRRLAFAQLLLHPAELWLLDEPQAALDMQALDLFLGLLHGHAARGGMAVVASHGALNITTDSNTLILAGPV